MVFLAHWNWLRDLHTLDLPTKKRWAKLWLIHHDKDIQRFSASLICDNILSTWLQYVIELLFMVRNSNIWTLVLRCSDHDKDIQHSWRTTILRFPRYVGRQSNSPTKSQVTNSWIVSSLKQTVSRGVTLDPIPQPVSVGLLECCDSKMRKPQDRKKTEDNINMLCFCLMISQPCPNNTWHIWHVMLASTNSDIFKVTRCFTIHENV